MINRLSDSKMFNLVNKKFNYTTNLMKVDFKNYYIPKEFYMDKISLFKGYKLPLVNETMKAVENGEVIPVCFSEPYSKSCKTGDLHTTIRLSNSLFNFNGYDGKPIVMADLSAKGKYMYANTNNTPIYFNIPEIILFHMLSAAFAAYKLQNDPKISESVAFFVKVAECYTLIVTKIIDNLFPIVTSSDVDYGKLCFLTTTFCLQNMFGINKEEAMKYAIKTKQILDKSSVQAESVYYQNDTLDFVGNADFKEIFPIDIFCNTICDEFSYITKESFNSILLSMKFNERLTKNAFFCLESGVNFIAMLMFGKASIGLFNDSMIKKYLQSNSYDITKEFAALCK